MRSGVELTWWQFVLPVVGLLGVALATISALVVKAARANPVLTLKVEN